jgi:hypothetical protein
MFVLMATGSALAGEPEAAKPGAGYPQDAPVAWPAMVSRAARGGGGRPGGRWKAATVEAALPRAVKAGELVTVLPLPRSLPVRDLPVTAVKEQPAMGSSPARWLVTVDASLPAFLTAKAQPGHADHRPFEAVVVQPANRRARLLSPKAAAGDLPGGKGASPATLWAAVDVTGDGKADVAIFRFCCENPASAPGATGGPPCPSECEAVQVRTPGAAWRPVYEASDD